MAIARAAFRAELLSTTSSLRRLYTTTTTTPSSSTQANQRPPRSREKSRWGPSDGRPSRPANERSRPFKNSDSRPKGPLMTVPQAAQSFLTNTAKLRTTPENWAFLQENHIEYDNAIATKLNLGDENSRIISNFTTKVLFSPSHIMHPHDLQYLDPRDHALAESMRAKYKKKVKEEPLWVIMLDQNSDCGLVRTMGKRRLVAAFWTAMKDLGYERFPEPGAPRIKGTLLVKIADATAAANFPAVRFGEAAAKSVVERWKSLQEGQERRGRQQQDEPRGDSAIREKPKRAKVQREEPSHERRESKKSTSKSKYQW